MTRTRWERRKAQVGKKHVPRKKLLLCAFRLGGYSAATELLWSWTDMNYDRKIPYLRLIQDLEYKRINTPWSVLPLTKP